MSRSYRKPYSTYAGSNSAKEDKRLAARGVRRAQNRITRRMLEDPDLLIPHRLECDHNEVYSWSRDGKQQLMVPDARGWSRYMLEVQGFAISWQRGILQWPPKWFKELTRK